MGPDGFEDPFVEATLSTWPRFINLKNALLGPI